MNKPAPILIKFVFKIAEFVFNIIWKSAHDGLKLTMCNFKITDNGTNYGTLILDGYCYWFIIVKDINKLTVAKQVSFVIPKNHLNFFEIGKIHVIDKTITEANIK